MVYHFHLLISNHTFHPCLVIPWKRGIPLEIVLLQFSQHQWTAFVDFFIPLLLQLKHNMNQHKPIIPGTSTAQIVPRLYQPSPYAEATAVFVSWMAYFSPDVAIVLMLAGSMIVAGLVASSKIEFEWVVFDFCWIGVGLSGWSIDWCRYWKI